MFSLRRLVVAVFCLAVVSLAQTGVAKEKPQQEPIYQNPTGSPVSLDRDAGRPLAAGAQAGTTQLAFWSWNAGGACDAQGWTSVDITAQSGVYWHVDDFAGLGGGSFGHLVALEGNQSMWLGARPSTVDNVLCSYATLPGYGNRWNQGLCTINCVSVFGDVIVDYLAAWDSEPGYDWTYVEVTPCTGGVSDENWVGLYGGFGVYDGDGSETGKVVIPDSLHAGQLQIRFHFTSDGAWSDQDGLWDTDGAFIVDSLSVSDVVGLVLNVEDFEGEAVGSTTANDWEACTPPGYGDFAALYQGLFLVQEDPCLSNLTCIWTFFTGSTVNYGCGGYPGQTAVPYVNSRNEYINNEVWSPLVPYVGSGTQVEYSFDTYRDLTLDALVFYVHHIRSWVGACPGEWRDRNFVFFGDQKDWLRTTFPVGDLIEPGATHVQVAVGVVDNCGRWCGVFGTGTCHSHAPLIDNFEIIRIATNGPRWSVRDIDLFQDNFATDGTTTGTVRADMANDILPSSSTNIVPGDSTTFRVSDPDAGLAADAYTGFGSAVYAYVAVWPQNQAGKGGAALTPDAFRWPVVDSLTHAGIDWYCIRTDTAFTKSADRTGALPNAFCVDLNDNLFTPGDTICFFFCAESAGSGLRSYWTPFTGTTTDLAEALSNPDEFTCLPAGGWNRGGDILYVDGMDGRGAQPFFDTAFEMLGIPDLVDRYDIRGPSSNVSNRPGHRVKDVFQQVIGCYRKIIWNTGDLTEGLIGDGTGNPEKADDASMLFTFLDNLPNTGGIYFSGDDLANEWQSLAGVGAFSLRNYIQHTVVSDDHVSIGLGISPFGVGEVNGCFDQSILGPDTLVAYGGCPIINNFDVLAPLGPATLEMSYHGKGLTGGAVVGQRTTNIAGFDVGVLLSGFSYHYIRDDRAAGLLDRAIHLHRILSWLENVPPVPVDVPGKTAYRNSLDQNYPNPFNPTTTIRYTLADPGRAQLKIYNVAGQLVRTLVDEHQTAGVQHVIEWSGRSDAGAQVASGVYFYKLAAKGFTQTRKMVLLK